jgi:putative transposase
MRESEHWQRRGDLQAHIDRLSPAKREKGEAKAAALDTVATLCADGTGRVLAMQVVAGQLGIQLSTLYAWDRAVTGVRREDWVAALAPRHVGAQAEAACDPRAWARKPES